MKLPEDQYGNLDTSAIEHLLSVNQLLFLLFILGRPDKTLYQPDFPKGLAEFRSFKKLSDWGLVTGASAPTPEQPRRIQLTLTINGEILAMTYANEANRLTQKAVALLPSQNAD